KNASALLASARTAEADNKHESAGEALQWYLSLRPDDGPTWAWYARVVDEQDPGRLRLERTFLVHEQALRHNPQDRALKRRSADRAMELRRFGDAERLLTELLDATTADSPGQSAIERAELDDLLGQCRRGLGKNEDAEKSFELALKHDPHRVDCYDRLA